MEYIDPTPPLKGTDMPLDPVNGLLDHLTKQLEAEPPHQDPVSMGLADALQRLFTSRKKDINLPAESGRSDARIAQIDPTQILQRVVKR